jgi:cytoskeletal protein CcmA (bactofilin family)
MASWAPLGLISVTAALLAVPVMPALYELRKRGDVAPLPTSRHDGRIENFSAAFCSRVKPFLLQFEQCRAQREVSRTNLDGTEVLLVGRDDFDFDSAQMRGVAAVLCSDLMIPAGRVVDSDVYAEKNLTLGRGSAVRAAFAHGDITVSSDSAILRWIHAQGRIFLAEGSAAYGRLSADLLICLQPGCSFQHMHAPSILTVRGDGDSAAADLPMPDTWVNGRAKSVTPKASDAGPPIIADEPFASRRRVRVRGDFVLPPGETMNANLIATGDLRLASGSRFFGSAKSYRDLVVGQGASVEGSIISGRTLHLGVRCFVAGPILAEGEVVMSPGVQVGALGALTTISCRALRIASGCRLHGTVWARIRGLVED